MRRQPRAVSLREPGYTRRPPASWRGLTTTLAGMMLLVAFVAGPALAKGSPVQPQGTEVCWVDPNPSTNGVWYTVYGTGFKPGQMVNVFVQDQYSTGILMATTD